MLSDEDKSESLSLASQIHPDQTETIYSGLGSLFDPRALSSTPLLRRVKAPDGRQGRV